MRDAEGKRCMKGINEYLLSHPEQWQEFVASENLQTTVSTEFPKCVGNVLLYEALSDEIHNPLELCVLKLPAGVKTPYLVLLQDIGLHYHKKAGFSCPSVDVGWAYRLKMGL